MSVISKSHKLQLKEEIPKFYLVSLPQPLGKYWKFDLQIYQITQAASADQDRDGMQA